MLNLHRDKSRKKAGTGERRKILSDYRQDSNVAEDGRIGNLAR